MKPPESLKISPLVNHVIVGWKRGLVVMVVWQQQSVGGDGSGDWVAWESSEGRDGRKAKAATTVAIEQLGRGTI